VGNSLEVKDAIKTLEGKGDKNFTNLCIILSSYMVSLARSISTEEAIDMVKTNLYNGEGLKKFKEFIKYQGGDLSKLETNYGIEIYSRKSGYITDIDTMKLAMLVRNLGAGRINKDDSIDHTVGVELFKHINDKVEENDLLLKVYTDDIVNKLEYLNLFTISDNKIEDIKIVLDIIK
jgi:pyrimidine-nucleoside phosphorylase